MSNRHLGDAKAAHSKHSTSGVPEEASRSTQHVEPSSVAAAKRPPRFLAARAATGTAGTLRSMDSSGNSKDEISIDRSAPA
jgi:hypothetical protein